MILNWLTFGQFVKDMIKCVLNKNPSNNYWCLISMVNTIDANISDGAKSRNLFWFLK